MKVLKAGDGVQLVRDIRIPMRDGAHLAADLYVPDTDAGVDGLPGEALPIVMDYLPYRKDEVDPTVLRHYLELPRHGYAVARVDIRGTGGSEGHVVDEYVAQEQVDGYDAIEWLAAQPWCDGHVNMMGISYGGFTALQVATTQPPHLTSIIPVDFTDDRYTDDCHYRGGLLRMYYDLAWYGSRMIAWNAMPTDPTFAVEGSRAIWERHLAEDEPYLLAWLRHQVDGPYWRQGSVADIVERITCPAFLIGGWRDGYPNPPLRLFERLAGPKKLLVGPWDHRYPEVAIPGPRIDHLREVVRWLDHWCRGIDTGVMDEPPIVVYMQEAGSVSPTRTETAGRWRAERSWPPEGASQRTMHLGAEGGLVEDDGDDPASTRASTGSTSTQPLARPAGCGRAVSRSGFPAISGPTRRVRSSTRRAPLRSRCRSSGVRRRSLNVASSAAVLGIAVSLSDVAADGTSHLVAKGMLNVTRRRSMTAPEPLKPGTVETLTIDIDATGWRFESGHRVRLAIAGADFPNVWPTPELATLDVHRGGASPSLLHLPVVPNDGPVEPPTFDPSPVVVRHGAEFQPPATWAVTRDELTGRVTATVRVETSHVTPEGARIDRDMGCTCEVDPADPARAVARGWNRCRNARDGHTTEGSAEVDLASSAEEFHLTIDLAIGIDGAEPVTRRWDEHIPRVLL